MIPFNKPFMTGRELDYIRQAVDSGKISGDGVFTRKCHAWLEQHLGRGRAFLTSSCTDALEAAALLCDIEPSDEVMMPSYASSLQPMPSSCGGARIRFLDSETDPSRRGCAPNRRSNHESHPRYRPGALRRAWRVDSTQSAR